MDFRLATLRTVLGATTVIVALLGVVASWVPAASAQPVTGYAGWEFPVGSVASWTGTASMSAVRGFPDLSYVTNSLSPSVPTGAATWLGASTPFGSVFGSSQGKSYLQARYTSGTEASTTTFSFAGATPTQRGTLGWGFALGDIDADSVTLSATTTNGAAVTAAELGWQGGFNLCDVSPRPTGCTGGGYTDVPTWDATTATLTGNGSDTSGAAGWFRPTVPLATLTLVFTPITGLPVFNLWMAGAGGTSVAGTVTCRVDDGVGAPIEGLEVRLGYDTETPVTVGGVPLTTTTAADGSYAFEDLTPGFYVVEVANDEAVMVVGADARNADATGVDADLPCDEPPSPSSTSSSTSSTSTTLSPTTTSTPTPTTGVQPSVDPAPGGPTTGGLPATGVTGLGTVVGGSASVAVGAAMALAARRRR